MYISAAALLAAASVVVPAVAVKTFDSTSRNNVVVYWGQGAGQGQLSAVCDNDDIDIVVVGFVNVYPSAATGGYPGTNFGNQCSGTTYQTTVNGQTVSTGLLNSCPGIGPGIKACQAKGVKVLLSIGGAAPADGFLESNAAGVDFANFLWGAFGPSTTAWTNAGKPRPFGDAAFDGFDLDIETVRASAPKDSNGNTVTDWKTRGYTALVNQLRANLDSVSDTPRYLSAAPQCVVPDAYLQDSITKGLYDFIFVQLYNTAQCSAKSGLFDLNNWVFTNPNVRVFIGLLADPTDEYYLTPTEVRTRALQQNNVPNFGGIMVWDSASSQGNTKCGKEYASWMKTVLKSLPSGTFTETCPVSSSIRPSSSVFSSSIKPSSSVFSSSIKPSSSIFSSSIKPSSSVFSSSIKPSSSVFSSSIKPSTPFSRAASSRPAPSSHPRLRPRAPFSHPPLSPRAPFSRPASSRRAPSSHPPSSRQAPSSRPRPRRPAPPSRPASSRAQRPRAPRRPASSPRPSPHPACSAPLPPRARARLPAPPGRQAY
ncbi:glycoside hydrolase [Trichodelitschia bisporula]|uniref:chitinase n=1 Tax=Trichodelitschia bisporula TaxID=703511 RepID=A0A6G1HNW3_9PEZI|nr:glycoside hydrolase [Trichodelitschia bisporula]